MGYGNWTLAMRGWADEKTDFVYGSKVQTGAVGHYTQVYNRYSMCLSYFYDIDGEKHNSTHWLWFSYLS
jgi:hypothetical protein